MSVRVRSPRFSFVQFATADYGYVAETYDTCYPGVVQFCLPVYAYDDVAFQFIVETDTVEEADELCSLSEQKVKLSLLRECGGEKIIDFHANGYFPTRVRISERQVLYNWEHGLPGFDIEFEIEDCMYVQVEVEMDAGTVTACSNCFQRIAQDCFTSVMEYGAEQNIFGFNYCGSGAMFEDEQETCEEPTLVSFTNATEIDYAYTDEMREKYGDVPTVEIWILQGSEYVQTMIRAGFDAYPPTRIIADLGGEATGFMKIS